MFFGEAMCLIIYLSTKNKLQKDEKLVEGLSEKVAHKPYIFIIPAMADTCTSILQYMGLNFIAASTYMMLRGATIITVAIFSKILLKNIL